MAHRFFDVSDVVAANLAAMHTPHTAAFGNVINIGTGHESSVNEIFSALKNISSSSFQPLFQQPRKEPHRACADITRAQVLLNWHPKVSLQSGLKETFEYYKNQHAEKIISSASLY